MAATSQQYMVAMGGHGTGLADGTKRRAKRLAKMWRLLLKQPCTVLQISKEMKVHWRTTYIDIVDLEIDPLEDGLVLRHLGNGWWRVCDIREPSA